MSEEQTENEKKPQPNETGGFRFAVTLLAALGTISYALFTYLQTTPVDPFWYCFVCGLIAFALILVFCLLLYLLIKGYSLEMHDNLDQKKRLEKWASSIYLAVFSMSIILLVLILVFFIMDYVLKIKTSEIAILFMAVLLMIVVALILIAWRKESKERIFNLTLIMECAIFAFLIIILVLSILFYITPLQGHITVDMERIYYKNDALIPVLIHTTGPNTNLSIGLFKKESNDTLSLNDSIMLIPDHNPSFKTVSGKYLVGNMLDYGTYNVFINTTDLSVGYYELMCWRSLYWKTYSKKGFCLVNSSERSCIKE